MAQALREAYERTDFEMVDNGALKLPSSTPAHFTPDETISPKTAADLEENLPEPYAFISPTFNLSERDETEFQLHTRMYDSITNEDFSLKVFSELVLIFPKSERFSFKTFRRAVTTLEDLLDTDLRFVEEYDDW